jgi:hypothetical protein
MGADFKVIVSIKMILSSAERYAFLFDKDIEIISFDII